MNYTKVTIKINTKDRPPYFMGSQLRGAFGYALKKVTCINPSYNCNECFALSNCLFYEFYEEKNVFHKYRLDFTLGQEFYDFSFYLFDNKVSKLPYIVSAFYMLLTKNGLGKNKIIYNNFDIYINDILCTKNSKIDFPKNCVQKLTIGKIYKNIKLKFVTPLRIKAENKFIRDDNIDLANIVNSIYQRQMNLLGRDRKKFPYEIVGTIIKKDLKYQELTRFSNRQKSKMNLGGIVGEIDIDRLNKETYEVLKVGELLAVGKQTVFGLGKIQILEKE